uniref:subtilisin n=2 Tax=Lotharella globosa TaxID=91324 RepID=A0A7S3YK42_9EUKA|mmetsp:Transcript_17336/g.34972  ORF Transcript_17336/g.34972 Transcript_17336/m.34972 type:complete len:457 (+) Transcript_17336:507-1877(+)
MAGATKTIVAPNRDMITVTLPVEAAEFALNTSIHAFRHKEHKQVRILRASQGYSLPEHIADDVVMVGELLQFPRLRSKELSNLKGSGDWPNACDAAACSGLVTPDVLKQRYKLPDPSSQSSVDGNSMAVAEFQGQYYRDTDIGSFAKSCHRDVTVDVVVGGNRQRAGVEAELDIEYIKGVAPSVPLTVIYNNQFSLLDWANSIVSNDSSPLVHSVSYGNDEAQQTSAEYMFTCNTAFMKAGTMGRSILFASGDQGVCGREGCGGMFKKRTFNPDFPGGSPYITVVGGTNFEGSSIGAESAWNNGGGGFSNTFDIPAYQTSAVQAYKQNPDAQLPPQYLWNNTGRGYPDVAALGGQKTPYCVATSGRFAGVAGTSASCPVVAGVFALLNGLRLAAGKSPMGFLNPFIYKNPSAFQDVKSGRNDAGTSYGFTAIEGWDAATGFGTPDYEAMKAAAMQF